MRIQQVEAFHADLPFRFSFKHAAAERAVSESIFVKLRLDNGVEGWGEGLPRAYVTGETVPTAMHALRHGLGPLASGFKIEKLQDTYDLISHIHLLTLSLP